MPIRFRCVYCDKLLGIAHRKAGAVVNCPQCGQPLIVPTPEPAPSATASAVPAAPPPVPGKLFERDDFEAMLQGDLTVRTPGESPRRTRGARKSAVNPLPPKPFPVERTLPQNPAPEPMVGEIRAGTDAKGLTLPTGIVVLLLVLVFVLIGLAFGGGFLVGRMIR